MLINAKSHHKMSLLSLLRAPPEVTPPPGRHRPKRGKQSKFLLMPKAATRCRCHYCYQRCQRSLHCQVGIGLIKWGRKHVLVNACSCYKMPLPSLLLAPPEVTPPPGRHRPKRGEQSVCLLMPKTATRCRSHHCYERRQRSLHHQLSIGLIKGGRMHVFFNAYGRHKMLLHRFY